MDIIKKLFTFNDDDGSIIGLCKFNDSFFKACENKENMQKKLSKNQSLSEMLKRPV